MARGLLLVSDSDGHQTANPENNSTRLCLTHTHTRARAHTRDRRDPSTQKAQNAQRLSASISLFPSSGNTRVNAVGGGAGRDRQTEGGVQVAQADRLSDRQIDRQPYGRINGQANGRLG